MYIFLAILIVIACVLLIGVVLIQKSKGGGLASDFSSGNQFIGYRKTTDFIEKATWSLAIFICIISIFASFAIKGTHFNRSSIAPAAPQQKQTEAPAPAPGATTPVPAEGATAPAAATEAAPAADADKAADAPTTDEAPADNAEAPTQN